MDETVREHLVAMMPDVGHWTELPDSLIDRCEEIDKLIKKVKSWDGIISTQILAVIVYQWKQEQLNSTPFLEYDL